MESDTDSVETETVQSPAPRGPANLLIGLAVSAFVVFLAVLNVLSLFASFDWQWDLLTHFRFQYLVGFGVAGLGLLLLRWRKMAAVALAGLLLNAWFVVPLYLPNSETRHAAVLRADNSAPAVTFLHFNVHTANPRKQDVAALIQKSGADVVFLQEINRAWVSALDGRLAGYEPVLLDPRSDNFGIGMWVREGSPLTVESAELVDLSGGLAQVNAVDAVLRQADGSALRVVSLHTLPPVSGAYAAARDAQLAGASAMAHRTPGAFVLIGDLNATPWSASYRALVRDGGLADSLRGRAGWPTAAPGASWPAGLVSLGMIPIDHCLTSGGAVVVERELGDAAGSDHRPLFVTVRLAE
ncbi:MAG: endonuclease/exonuclease/phosphatase family protein [Planctomycetota bacterium]